MVNFVDLHRLHSFSAFSLLLFQLKAELLHVQLPSCQQRQLLCALLTLYVFGKFCFRSCLLCSQAWKSFYCGAGVVYKSFYFCLHWNAAGARHAFTKRSWKWKHLSVTGIMCLSDWELEASILLFKHPIHYCCCCEFHLYISFNIWADKLQPA